MFALFFLLLPIAAGYGWYMGSRNAQQRHQLEANRLSRDYVDGVSFLLSDKKEKALELFLELVKDESSTLEAHLTLGNLFRVRGEVDKAIRIHQALIESTSLNFEQKLLVLYQLGLDYMAAGFYDRAESVFVQLTDENEFQLSALQQLLLIYQITSDWIKSIQTAERLIKTGQTEYKIEVAQFYCELASQAISSDDLDKSMEWLKKAIGMDNTCVRASIMMGRINIAQASYEPAIAVLKNVLAQDKAFISEALPLLKLCYMNLSQEAAFSSFLSRCVEEDTGEEAESMMADLIEQREGRQQAATYLYDRLQQRPSMTCLNHLMRYQIHEAEEGKAKEGLRLLQNVVAHQIQQLVKYQCRKCGLTTKTLYWHCPSCRAWSSIKPARYVERYLISK